MGLGTVHSPHTLPTYEAPHILYDGCERCAEHATSPFLALDDYHLKSLIDLLDRGIDYGDRRPDGSFYCEVEIIACRNIEHVMRQFARIEKVRSLTTAAVS